MGNCEFRFVACAREQVATEIVDADVAVPLMTKIDETLLAKAPILKLVLQFGVGLEGVDEEACTKREHPPGPDPVGEDGQRGQHRGDGGVPPPRRPSQGEPAGKIADGSQTGRAHHGSAQRQDGDHRGVGTHRQGGGQRLRAFGCKLQAVRKSEWPKEEWDFLLYDEEVRPLDDVKWIKTLTPSSYAATRPRRTWA